MYYAETIIGGRLYYRSTPRGPWRIVPAELLYGWGGVECAECEPCHADELLRIANN